MFCKFCGKELEDNSVFCNHCGERLSEKTQTEKEIEHIEQKIEGIKQSTHEINIKRKKRDDVYRKVILTFLVLIVGFCGVMAIANKITKGGSDGNFIDKIIERNLTSSDYTASKSQDLTACSITITAKTKITTCTVQCTLYDKNGKVLYSDTMTNPNLAKDLSYTYTFDFGFMNALTGSKVQYQITGKCTG